MSTLIAIAIAEDRVQVAAKSAGRTVTVTADRDVVGGRDVLVLRSGQKRTAVSVPWILRASDRRLQRELFVGETALL